jgi:hypothetical protein
MGGGGFSIRVALARDSFGRGKRESSVPGDGDRTRRVRRSLGGCREGGVCPTLRTAGAGDSHRRTSH